MAETKAVKLELTLAGTNTKARPRSEELDRSGKLTFEYDSSQANIVDEVMKLGYDISYNIVYTLHLLIERGTGIEVERKKRRGKRKTEGDE